MIQHSMTQYSTICVLYSVKGKSGSECAPERLAIMLTQALEDHSSGGGIHTHGKGLS